MSSLVFHIEADKADVAMLDSIKAFFGNRRVKVLVEPEPGPQSSADLDEKIARNQAAEVSYVFRDDEFAQVANQLLNDQPVDLEAYKQHKER